MKETARDHKNSTSAFAGKRVLVMGLGLHGGGLGSVRFLSGQGARITVTDLRSEKELAPSLAPLKRIKNITYVLGRHRESDFVAADIIIKNPGVRSDSSYLRLARRRGIPVTTDVAIFFRSCPGTIIGVSGTRGKSTTATLISLFLKTRHQRVFLAGNIRTSVLDILPRVRKGDLVVLELSSFQLTDLAREHTSPPVAVLTNILRDHLNWHVNMQEYQKAKAAIFRFQKPGDYAFINGSDRRLHALARGAPSRVVFPRLDMRLKPIVDEKLGEHYESSVALAAAVARHFGLTAASVARVLRSFPGLPERQEEIAVKKGIHFIDDTTATTPDAAVVAIKRFRAKAGTNALILIAGGSDKNLDFREMIRAIQRSADVIIFLPGSATRKMRSLLHEDRIKPPKTKSARSMNEAVRIAWRRAKRGDHIVLSPGAASFGLFLNEFDRGAQFKKAVRAL
ncbi:MAG: UDP-N-acetylmuramoyl-L-alanine--D-glutamate ligase [Candidatus Sungbacteria bacterium]|uniref:UDP-N-acetylmuramoylalanine--D-glutamate ligase n=1 Tax=Candidatus Sungiibacteriota bacterium TaxID=2750080 RepID=A0A932R201_9BACT|nr:UDP-N-acetylmuramoyl-L-alanine--D-glutamate ligase [Candidatus Sungbacteria bacterium]